MVIYGSWGLLMFLEPLSKCSGGFYIFFITIHPVTFISVDDSTFLQHRIFVLRSHQEVSHGITSFEVDLHPMFVACSFQAFTQPLVIWHHYVRVLVALLVVCIVVIFSLWFLWAGVCILIFTLFTAHTRYLHLVKTLCKWSSSCCSSSGLEYMVLALWWRVPITLYFDEMV